MKNILSFFKLNKEANLLDSKLYILKAFLAVIVAFVIANTNPILKLDIISVLFGLMLTLEPVTLTGIRNGLNQVYATVLGALSTAIIIYFFGINLFTIALSIAFTLYVCLKVDWRSASPVAIFTSIYMTQYVQKTLTGEPSIILTFRLRIYALLTGVIIAIIFNLIFSVFSYRSMLYNRIAFLMESVLNNLKQTKEGIDDLSEESILNIKNNLPHTFNNIDWVFSLFEDIKKEYIFKSSIVGFSKVDIEKLQNVILFLRSITHLNYDINYILLQENFSFNRQEESKEAIVEEFNDIISKLILIKETFDNKSNNLNIEFNIEDNQKFNCGRIIQDTKAIRRNVRSIYIEMKDIKPLNKKEQ